MKGASALESRARISNAIPIPQGRESKEAYTQFADVTRNEHDGTRRTMLCKCERQYDVASSRDGGDVTLTPLRRR